MKTLLLVLLLLPVPQNSELGFRTTYDRFKDETVVADTESLLPDRPGYVLFSVVGVIRGKAIERVPPRDVTIAITSFTDDWYFLNSENTFRVIQNDTDRYVIGKMKRASGDVMRGGVQELLLVDVPFSVIEKLSKAKKLEIQVGNYEAEIKPEQIKNIKTWVEYFK